MLPFEIKLKGGTKILQGLKKKEKKISTNSVYAN